MPIILKASLVTWRVGAGCPYVMSAMAILHVAGPDHVVATHLKLLAVVHVAKGDGTVAEEAVLLNVFQEQLGYV
jgi:hypothetical protein